MKSEPMRSAAFASFTSSRVLVVCAPIARGSAPPGLRTRLGDGNPLVEGHGREVARRSAGEEHAVAGGDAPPAERRHGA